MSDAVLDRRLIGRMPVTVPPVRAPLRPLAARAARWLAHPRLGGSIAHLDERLLADAGLSARDLGLGERMIRRFVAGGDVRHCGGTGM